MARLNHQVKHNGVFTNRSGESRDAYLFWSDAKGGFIVFDANTNRPLVNTAYPNLKSLRDNAVNFTLKTYELETVA